MSLNYDQIRVELGVNEIPRRWYNIASDLPVPIPPPLDPSTNKPADAKSLEAIFPLAAIRQEMSTDKYIDIPEEVRDAYLLLGRPSPLQRAVRLEKALKTPAKIFYKREDMSPCGSHKPNSSIPQAYYNMKEGVENLTTETGAGQWGASLAMACAFFDMNCTVFMVKASYEQKPYRRHIMETYGAKVFASPSLETEFGKAMREKDPNTSGSLGMAISEAIEVCVKSKNTKYSLGSVLNHVMLHQTVIGQETKAQLEKIDVTPDHMVACVGGGSNFAGFTFPMIGDKIKKKNDIDFVAVEPRSVPSITKGTYEYDFGDTAGLSPLLKMYTLGHEFVPSAIHAGGLRYHGMAPAVSSVVNQGYARAVSYEQTEVYEAAMTFAKTEGIIPAPESSHAIKATIELALDAKRKNEEKVIVFNLSGHGLLDMTGYASYIAGNMNHF